MRPWGGLYRGGRHPIRGSGGNDAGAAPRAYAQPFFRTPFAVLPVSSAIVEETGRTVRRRVLIFERKGRIFSRRLKSPFDHIHMSLADQVIPVDDEMARGAA